jgi:endonuclease/exonuclease/phosphatase family metal-dependent hydrolase
VRSRRKLVFVLVAFAISAGLYGWADSAFSWSADALGERGHDDAPALAPHQLRAVTFNAWKLSQPARVDGLVDALRQTGRSLAAGERELPELIAVQEIESRSAARELARVLEPTHEVTICECAIEDDGSLRSAVAIAVDRSFFTQRSSECIALDRVWPDHPRCAAVVELEHEGRTIHAAGVHLAWHIDNHEMAERLRAALDDRTDEAFVLIGDMNTWPGTTAYEVLTRAPLTDACPASGPTHFTGNRLDYVLASFGLRVVRALDRRASFEALEPSSSIVVPDACTHGRSSECPVSDHLPEGAVLELTD